MIHDRIRPFRVAGMRQEVINVYTHMYLCNGCYAVKLYVQLYQGQIASRWISSLLLLKKKPKPNMIIIHIFSFL